MNEAPPLPIRARGSITKALNDIDDNKYY